MTATDTRDPEVRPDACENAFRPLRQTATPRIVLLTGETRAPEALAEDGTPGGAHASRFTTAPPPVTGAAGPPVGPVAVTWPAPQGSCS